MGSKKIRKKAKRRAARTRSRVKGKSDRPRVSVFRSNRYIYAQVIDDSKYETIVSCSSLELKDLPGDKKSRARAVGLDLAKKAKNKGINSAVYDRGPFLYHGIVKELAEGLREGGLIL